MHPPITPGNGNGKGLVLTRLLTLDWTNVVVAQNVAHLHLMPVFRNTAFEFWGRQGSPFVVWS